MRKCSIINGIEYYLLKKGGGMVKSKILSLIVLGSAIIACEPAKAFWLVMDFGEIPGMVSSVSTGMGSLSGTVSQLNEMNDAFKAMGQSIDNIAQFGQDLRSTVTNIQDVANDTVDGVNENLGTDIKIPDDVNNGINSANDALGDGLDSVINKTQDSINKSNEYIEKGSQDIVKAQDAAKKADEEMQKLNEKNEAEKAKREQEKQKQASEPVEEEEEEEEIPENEELYLQQEEIIGNIEAFEEECKQVIAQMNDVLDTAINTLNKSSQKTNNILDKLEKSIAETEQLEPEDKAEITQKVADIRVKYQNMADRAVILVENAKENYNAEYQNKLMDGISNYKKTIESYFRGDVSKDEVLKKGEELKLTFAQINTSIDQEMLEQQKKISEGIKTDLKAVVAEIAAKKKELN